MTTYVHRTIRVPAAVRDRAAELCEALAGPAGAGMFEVGLSADGTEPATYYVSAGLIDAEMAALLDDPAVMHAACEQAGLDVTLEECDALLAVADVTDEEPFVAFERWGLVMVSGGESA